MVDFLISQNIEPKVDGEKLKLKYETNFKAYDEEDEEESKTDPEEESKNEQKDEEFPIKVSVAVCKVNENKYCIDFVLKDGYREAFIEHFQQLLDETVLSDY